MNIGMRLLQKIGIFCSSAHALIKSNDKGVENFFISTPLETMSALAPSHVLGSTIQASQRSSAKVVASTGPQIQGLAIKPKVEIKAKKDRLVKENPNQESVTIYGDASNGKQLAYFSTKGTYFGPKGFSQNIPIQPNEPDATQKRVFAFDGNIILHNASTITAPKQSVTFDNSTGRILPVVSSERYKIDIKPLGANDSDIDLSKFFDIFELKTYKNKEAGLQGEKQYGLIAETFSEFPDILIYKDGLIESINYNLVSLLAAQQVKLLKKQVADLETRLANLEAL